MQSRKNIWIINQYASTPEVGMGGRHYYLSYVLGNQGHDIHLIASSFGHKMRQPPSVSNKITVEDKGGFKMVWLKLPRYSGSGSPIRILNWFRFAFDLRCLPKFIPDKPDIIYYSSPSLIGYLGAERLAKKLGAKLVFEVRDIWPLTLQRIGGYSSRHPLLQVMSWIERRAYQKADIILSNLQAADVRIRQRGGDVGKFHWVPNGIMLEEVANPEPLPSEILEVIPEGKFVVGYIGAIGRVNAIECLLDAAELLGVSHPDVVFVMVGGGQLKQFFVEMSARKGLSNAIFINPVPKSQVQSVLNKFSACYLGWLDEDLYQFGIGANKIPEYLYSGKPILHAYSGACDPIQSSGAGLSVPSEDPKRLAAAVIRLYEMSDKEREDMGVLGRKYALDHYEFGQLAKKLSTAILE